MDNTVTVNRSVRLSPAFRVEALTELPEIEALASEWESLLAEVFSNQGVGTLIHANEYKAIRQAQKKDARVIHTLIQHGVYADISSEGYRYYGPTIGIGTAVEAAFVGKRRTQIGHHDVASEQHALVRHVDEQRVVSLAAAHR